MNEIDTFIEQCEKLGLEKDELIELSTATIDIKRPMVSMVVTFGEFKDFAQKGRIY